MTNMLITGALIHGSNGQVSNLALTFINLFVNDVVYKAGVQQFHTGRFEITKGNLNLNICLSIERNLCNRQSAIIKNNLIIKIVTIARGGGVQPDMSNQGLD